MGSKKRSDRERLLKLIDGDAATFKNIQSRKGIKIISKKIKELLFLIKQRLKKTLRKLRKGEISFSLLNLASFNKILIAILSIMVIYLVFDFASSFLRKEEVLHAQRPPAGRAGTTPNHDKPASGQAQIAKLSPVGYYLDQAGGKDLFSSQRIELVKGETLSEPPATGLKLVGVDWGGIPVAMIEDIQTQKTYFVKKGESIKELTVMEIFRDRVKLRYDNKVIELK